MGSFQFDAAMTGTPDSCIRNRLMVNPHCTGIDNHLALRAAESVRSRNFVRGGKIEYCGVGQPADRSDF